MWGYCGVRGLYLFKLCGEVAFNVMVTFNNDDLGIDLEKIKEMRLNGDCAIESNEDFNLGCSYCIDVEDESYWYANEEERDEDLKRLMEVLRKW